MEMFWYVSGVYFVSVFSCVKTQNTGTCPANGFTYQRTNGDKICYWVNTTNGTFNTGQTKCEQLGGNLAEIPDADAEVYVLDYISTNNYNGWSMYLGYKVDEFNNLLDRNEVLLHNPYTSFLNGEPSSLGSLECVYMCNANNGEWCDNSCNSVRQSLCSIETLQTTTSTVLTATTTTSTALTATTTTSTVLTATTTTSTAVTATTTASTILTATTITSTAHMHSIMTTQTYCNETSPDCNCSSRTRRSNSTANITPEDLRRELAVNKSSLSSVRRSKTSADDSRPSVVYIGSVGIVGLVTSIIVIISFDLFDLSRFFINKYL